MKKLMLIAAFALLTSNTSQAQVVARIVVRPTAVMVRPLCPGAGHVWVDGAWRWDRRARRNIWVEGYWAPRPRFHHYQGRMRRF